jgi:hypothetical protein
VGSRGPTDTGDGLAVLCMSVGEGKTGDAGDAQSPDRTGDDNGGVMGCEEQAGEAWAGDAGAAEEASSCPEATSIGAACTTHRSRLCRGAT